MGKRITEWIDSNITLHTHDSQKEERANGLTHALGALISFGMVIYVLIFRSADTGLLIFTLSMLLLYSASSLYHFLDRGVLKKLFRVLDHANIYILIAGTYTPILMHIGSPTSHQILALVWSIVVVGILFTLRFWERFKVLHILLYLTMGWMIAFFWDEIIPFLPSGLLSWIIAGGITYSVGVILYASKRIPYYHAIWHLFVLGGSTCFAAGLLTYL